MTTKQYQPATVTFPERPRRGDMQNILYLHRPGHIAALQHHFGSPETTLVMGDMPIGWSLSRQQGLLYPDLMVAFDVDTAAAIAQRGFSIEERGKSPDFVLEVASLNTALNDYTAKRTGYAAYGASEYWRFDPTGGRYYPVALAGERLVDGEYHPIPIEQTPEGWLWGHSEVLGLALCWEDRQLRWYDPSSQTYLLTHDEALDTIVAERDARIAAESARIAAETRIRQLEEELRRRQQPPEA